jgi:hypothetical protein
MRHVNRIKSFLAGLILLAAVTAGAVISTEITRDEYVGDDSTTVFAYNFKVLDADSIDVYDGGTLQVRGSHYTVSGVGVDTGGNVTFITAPDTGNVVILLRDEPNDQQVDVSAGGWSSMTAAEDTVDKGVMQVQQLEEKVGRALKIPTTSLLEGIDVPVTNCNDDYLKWNASTTAIECATQAWDATAVTLPLSAANGGTGTDMETGYTVAGLPAACTEGSTARLTDGGAKNAIVQCDPDGVTWRCQDEYTKHELNPYCPPYNAEADATDGTNHTAMQALLTRALSWDAGDAPTFWSVYLGEDVLTINSTLETEPNPETSTLVHIFSHGNGGLKFTGGGAYGWKIGGTVVGNIIKMNDIQLIGSGVTTSPTALLDIDGQTQVYLNRVKISGPYPYGVQTSGANGHTSIANGLCTENAVGPVGGACIYLNGSSNSELIIEGNMGEGAVEGSELAWLRFGNSATVNVFRFINNGTRGNSWDCMIDMTGSNNIIIDGVITNNVAMELDVCGFDLRSTAGNSVDELIIANNSLSGCTDACGTTDVGIAIFDASNVIVSNNVIQDFDYGLKLDGTTTGFRSSGNIYDDIATTCVDIAGSYSYLDIGPYSCDGGATADLSVIGTSSGNNHIQGVVATDGSVPILTTTNLDHATDTLELANAVQQEACTTTLTLTPVYKNIHLAGTNACAVTIAERPGNGQDITIAVTASGGDITLAESTHSAGVVELAGGVTWTAGTVNDVLKLTYLSDTVTNWVETGRSDN